jgi:hypothetical protein
MNRRREARRKLKTLCYEACTPVIDNIKFEHHICQAYCYVPPMNLQEFDNDSWKGLVELFLEAMYENTLYIAGKHSTNGTCYIVPLGEQYGVSSLQVSRAIQRACNIASSKNIKLNVKLVHKTNNYDNTYNDIPKHYPLGHVSVASVWDS